MDAVHALIARRVGAASAPDITAEAFEIALRAWDQFDAERGTERLFVFGAATAAIRRHPDIEREHLRSLRIPRNGSTRQIFDPLVSTPVAPTTRPRPTDPGDDEPGDPTPVTDGDALDARAMRAVADLDPDDRDIVLLSLWESCSQNAIAEVLDLTVGTVRSSLGRIRRELKVAVTEDEA